MNFPLKKDKERLACEFIVINFTSYFQFYFVSQNVVINSFWNVLSKQFAEMKNTDNFRKTEYENKFHGNIHLY